MLTYEKRIIGTKGETQIEEIYPDGRRLLVSDNQDMYTAWLEEGNTPDEIAYVAPPQPIEDTRTPAEKRKREYQVRTDPLLLKLLAYETEEGMDGDDAILAEKVIAARATWKNERDKIRVEFPDA